MRARENRGARMPRPERRRPPITRARWLSVAAAVTLGAAGLGAAPATVSQGTCLLGLIGQCSTPSASPVPSGTPSESGAPAPSSAPSVSPEAPGVVVGVPGSDGTITVPGELPPSSAPSPDAYGHTGGDTGREPSRARTPTATATPLPPLLGTPDPDGTVFASNPSTLQGSSMDITGLRGVGVVLLPTAGGGHVPAIEIDCEQLVVHELRLTVHFPASDLVTTSPALSLTGDVHAYLSGIDGTVDATKLAFTPDRLPSLEQLQGLVQLTLKYLGSTADSSSWPDVEERGVAS